MRRMTIHNNPIYIIIHHICDILRSVQESTARPPSPGNVSIGRDVSFLKDNCQSCHVSAAQKCNVSPLIPEDPLLLALGVDLPDPTDKNFPRPPHFFKLNSGTSHSDFSPFYYFTTCKSFFTIFPVKKICK